MTTRLKKLDQQLLADLRQVLRYDPNTGQFTWLIHTQSIHGAIFPGDLAGTRSAGRIQIGYRGVTYRAHVLAHWFMTGENVPEGYEIDHRDRNPGNNRWSNLRLVERSLNNHNSNPCVRNTSGVRGVSWVSDRNYWTSRINVDGKVYVLGNFKIFADAVAARIAAEIRHFGEAFSTQVSEPLHQPAPTPKALDKRRTRTVRGKVAEKKRRTNSSGYPGVSQHPRTRRWNVRTAAGWVGSYETLDAAVEARRAAIQDLYGE
jgi:hypothetical protein